MQPADVTYLDSDVPEEGFPGFSTSLSENHHKLSPFFGLFCFLATLPVA